MQPVHAACRPRADLVAGIACGLGAGALWGGVFLAPRVLADFTALQLAAGRYVTYGAASLLVVAPALGRLRRQLGWGDWITLAWLGLVGNLAYYVCLARGVALAGVAPASLIVGLLPVTIALGGRREDGIGLRRLAGPLLLIACGIGLVNVQALARMPAGTGRTSGLLGLGCDAGALAAWTLYAIGNARALKLRPALSGTDWSMLTGLVTGLLALGLAVPAFTSGTAHATERWALFWAVSAAIAVGASMVGNSLWNVASRRLPIGLGGMMVTFETVFALLYGFLQDGRGPGAVELAAIVSLLGGVVAAGLAFSSGRRTPH